MKFSFLFLIAALLTATSCSKSTNTKTPTGGGTPASPYKMTATIGSTAFSRDSCVFYHPNVLDSTDAELFGWAGGTNANANYYPQIYLYFSYSYHGIGTYTFSNPGNNNAKLITASGSGDYAFY